MSNSRSMKEQGVWLYRLGNMQLNGYHICSHMVSLPVKRIWGVASRGTHLKGALWPERRAREEGTQIVFEQGFLSTSDSSTHLSYLIFAFSCLLSL